MSLIRSGKNIYSWYWLFYILIEVNTLWLSCVCVHVCLCIHGTQAHVCIYVCACACTCVYISRSWRKTSSGFFYPSLLYSSEIGSVTELVTGLVASGPQWSLCFCSPNCNSSEPTGIHDLTFPSELSSWCLFSIYSAAEPSFQFYDFDYIKLVYVYNNDIVNGLNEWKLNCTIQKYNTYTYMCTFIFYVFEAVYHQTSM